MPAIMAATGFSGSHGLSSWPPSTVALLIRGEAFRWGCSKTGMAHQRVADVESRTSEPRAADVHVRSDVRL